MSASPAPRLRHRNGTGTLLAALAVLVVTAAVAAGGGVTAGERTVFRWGNADGPPEQVLWAVMQLGNALAVPAAAGVALLAHRRRLALQLLLGGTVAYLLARVLKSLVDRGRPAELLLDVQLRGADDSGRGYPSGHAAVAVVLATLVLPHLGRTGRWVVSVAAVLVCLARIHVGAHLPLDVVGGAALGVVCALAVRRASDR